MNSMFSSFDAFSAEFLGQKVRASFVSATKKVNNMQSESKDSTRVNKTSHMEKKQEGGPSSSKASSGKARFAPELDGLNCFETIVSY
ncbi:hypothetical protein Patl1_17389 [Pistacia atlantica]|uniref:Uncharacterized protein n=1 Tax=Pistacia atlantica TaxID=434234 RepID=A0ACC1BXX1_9ROSI|nr:hypothetical protein Patl1_17389 [Pistacia atlantica]